MDSNLPRRKRLRLADFDYSHPGVYFVTTCLQQRAALLGTIVEGDVHLGERGDIVLACWQDLPRHYPFLQLDEFVVMPDHVHGLLFLEDDLAEHPALSPVDAMGLLAERAGLRPAPTADLKRPSLSEVVRALKSFSARQVNAVRGTPGKAFWQRGFFERVVRNREEVRDIRRYIRENPRHWVAGQFHRSDDAFLGRLVDVNSGRDGRVLDPPLQPSRY